MPQPDTMKQSNTFKLYGQVIITLVLPFTLIFTGMGDNILTIMAKQQKGQAYFLLPITFIILVQLQKLS